MKQIESVVRSNMVTTRTSGWSSASDEASIIQDMDVKVEPYTIYDDRGRQRWD